VKFIDNIFSAWLKYFYLWNSRLVLHLLCRSNHVFFRHMATTTASQLRQQQHGILFVVTLLTIYLTNCMELNRVIFFIQLHYCFVACCWWVSLLKNHFIKLYMSIRHEIIAQKRSTTIIIICMVKFSQKQFIKAWNVYLNCKNCVLNGNDFQFCSASRH